ncbi:TIGR02679 family protein [Actinacidiphila sp. ITFR-21]|uniref:TIGR02679 family protein n=1 Tax=Actinacidiphila sp. ITFR-21 TaxID=3075199 RepID=UPI0028895A86|nr:TIGR02679 family protein [Streptomyces sp. ITFR-21]WNI16343.1 TIGR02679 family protein [Streptomyces sp. ITFR-21]
MSDFAGLDGRALRPLWQAVHERLSSGRPVSRVRIGPLDDEQRSALADLLGLDRLPDVRPSVALARLEEAVADAGGRTLRDVVAGLVGPLDDRAAVRQLRKDERDELWAWLEGHETVRSQPALGDWVAQCRSGGLIDGSVPRTRDLLSAALAVLAALPAEAEPLPVFAARMVSGDSHALDDGTRLSSLVLRALSAMHAVEMPGNAQQRRGMWARAGVADDELSGTVLAAGLRLVGDGLLSRITGACTQAGHAASLTLAQLRDPGDLRPCEGPVHITENPSVMALALRRFGTACPPLVCTSGWPNSAAVHLLRLLADHGAVLRYHGDFDGEGIRIAAYVLDKTPAAPWRMTAADYRDALTRTAHGPAVGRLTTAPWDLALTEAMAEHGTAVLEETVAGPLLDDLASAGAPSDETRGIRL